MTDRQTDRIDYVDGIRGIASILVVFCHLACVFLPGLYFQNQANTLFEKLWLSSPLNVITNGNASVQCFFVLSGFLITRKVYLSSEGRLSSPINTYVKLLHIVIPAVIFAAMLMVTNQMYHMRALETNSTLMFVNDYNNFSVSISDVLKDIFVRTFLKGSNYVGPFWTIKYEILGSILITAISYFVFEKMVNRKLCYILFGGFLYSMIPQLFPFMIGAFMYDCVYSKNDSSFLGRVLAFIINKQIILWIVFCGGIYLFTVNSSISSIWNLLRYLPYEGSSTTTIRSIGFSVCLFCINEIDFLRQMLSCRPLRFFGKISAYVYAFHWPIILSVGCGLFLVLQNIPYYFAVAVVSIVVLVTSILLSYAYMKFLSIVLCAENRLGRYCFETISNLKTKRKH